MHGFSRRAIIVLAAFAALLAAPMRAEAQAPQARVFAASSLTDVLTELGQIYTMSGQPAPVFNFAASSVLARQIEQGADADLFISADEEWMDYLAERRLIDTQTRVSFLSNRLVLIAPSDRPLSLHIRAGFPLLRALRGGRLAMADPDSVPAGRYGRAALEHLGVWPGVAASVVRAENVRTALRFVETGDAAAGVVYLTDALASGARVRIVDTFPETSHPRISYPIAVIAGGRAEGHAFALFLQSMEAKTVFRRYGFVVP